MNYWLVKSEPFKFSFDELLRVKKTMWDGVRNYQARNNLAAMQKGDLLLFYHSNEGKEVVGLAKVEKESYPDPTAEDPRWVVVDVVPVRKLKKTVTLEQIKAEERLQQMMIIRHTRLSVIPVKAEEFDVIMELAGE